MFFRRATSSRWTAVSRISAELCIEEQVIPDLYIEACRSGSLLPI